MTAYREVSGKPVFVPPEGSTALADNNAWTHRHEYFSPSGKVYILAVEKNTGQWSCSCPSWIFRHKCKHLDALRPVYPTTTQRKLVCRKCGEPYTFRNLAAIPGYCDDCYRLWREARIDRQRYPPLSETLSEAEKTVRRRSPRKPKPELVPLSLPRKIQLDD